jgi:3-oxoadipate enol-lactonase
LEARYRVIRYDTRGHGGTAPLQDGCTLAVLQDDVVALLDHLQVERTYYAGLSLGGIVGFGLGLDHPDRLLGLAICNARADAVEGQFAVWQERIDRVLAGGIETLIEPNLGRWFTPAFLNDNAGTDWMRAMMRTTTTTGFVCCARALQGLADLDYKSRLGDVRVPVLYLTGEQDMGTPPEIVHEMQRLTPGSRQVIVAGAAHISIVEQPEAVADAILEFFGTQAGPDRPGRADFE